MRLNAIVTPLLAGHSKTTGSVADRLSADALNLSAAPAPQLQEQQPADSSAGPAAPPLPGTTSSAAAPPLPTEAPRPVVRAPVRPAAGGQARAAAPLAPLTLQATPQSHPTPKLDLTAPASSTPQQ